MKCEIIHIFHFPGASATHTFSDNFRHFPTGGRNCESATGATMSAMQRDGQLTEQLAAVWNSAI